MAVVAEELQDGVVVVVERVRGGDERESVVRDIEFQDGFGVGARFAFAVREGWLLRVRFFIGGA